MFTIRTVQIGLLMASLVGLSFLAEPAVGSLIGTPHIALLQPTNNPHGQLVQTSIMQPQGHAVVDTIPVGSYPIGVAYNPNTNKVYVATFNSSSPGPVPPGIVYVLDAVRYSVIRTITVGPFLRGIAVNPVTNLVYVARYGYGQNSAISIINGTTDTLASTIVLPYRAPYFVAVNPNLNQIYVTEYDFNMVAVINGSNNKIVANITVGQSPYGIAVLPSLNRVYVSNFNSGSVSVIDGATNAVVATLQAGTGPSNIAVNPTSGEVYVSNSPSASISIFNSTNNTHIGDIPTAFRPTGLAVDSNRNLLFVTGTYTGGTRGVVQVINAANNTVLENIPVCNDPYEVAVDGVTGTVFVSNYASNAVSVIGNSSDASLLSLSASTTTSFVGFVVTATGTLTGWNSTTQKVGSLENEPVTIVFALQNGNSNQNVDVRTNSNGGFSAQWIPTITGNYLITAFRPESSCLTSNVSLSVLPIGSQYIFSVASNSTISSLSFNSTSGVLAFQLSGSTPQVASVAVSISKTFLATTASLQVLANSLNTSFSATDAGQSWIILFGVHLGNTASIIMRFQAFVTPSPFTNVVYVLLPAIGGAVAVGGYVLYRVRKNPASRKIGIQESNTSLRTL